ncbi:MAG: hypothetical protein Q8Q56_01695 [Alphaproteobacteria bacterium]|nr:hypothetical protein [Alphaproteobacteria bacterium]
MRRVAVGAAGAVAVCTHEISKFLADKNIQLTAAVEMKEGDRLEAAVEWVRSEGLTRAHLQYSSESQPKQAGPPSHSTSESSK